MEEQRKGRKKNRESKGEKETEEGGEIDLQQEGGERGEREQRKERGRDLMEILHSKNKDILGIEFFFNQNYVVLKYIGNQSLGGVLHHIHFTHICILRERVGIKEITT